MNTEKLTSLALTGLDRVGYQLESFGISDRVNRHSLAALLMTEKIRFEGELDSLNAKTIRYRYMAENTAETALKPARKAADTLRSILGKA